MRKKVKKKKPPNIKHTRTPMLPPVPFHNFFLWCIHFSKVTSEAFPSWLLKQKKNPAFLKKCMKPSLWLGLLPCVRMPREKKRGVGGADIFPRLFLSPEEEDEDGVMSEVPFVQQHESLSSSFRYTIIFFLFSFHYRFWCHLFLLPPQEKGGGGEILLPLCLIYSGNLFEDSPNMVGEGWFETQSKI